MNVYIEIWADNTRVFSSAEKMVKSCINPTMGIYTFGDPPKTDDDMNVLNSLTKEEIIKALKNGENVYSFSDKESGEYESKYTKNKIL